MYVIYLPFSRTDKINLLVYIELYFECTGYITQYIFIYTVQEMPRVLISCQVYRLGFDKDFHVILHHCIFKITKNKIFKD